METSNPYLDKLNHWSSHWQIATYLGELPDGARILDVGAASGTLARLCKNRAFELRGIEPVTEWLSDVRELYSAVQFSSLEQTPDTFLQGHTAVVCGDILEHLARPEVELKRLVNLQPEGCMFVISVPNVVNIWIRLHVLMGHFDYAERGILDRTHLRFFTRRTFLVMIQQAGLVLEELHATSIPLDLIHPFFGHNKMGIVLFGILARVTGWWPTLLGYQWIAKARKH